jgi:hypothetical protein
VWWGITAAKFIIGILLIFLHFSERFQDPATLSLADRISERNSQIPLVLRGTENL